MWPNSSPAKHSPKFLQIPCIPWEVMGEGTRRDLNSLHSMPNMTGRPGHRKMEMNGGSSAPYLARTPCVPLFSTLLYSCGNRRVFRLGGGSFPLYGGTFARSYSASIHWDQNDHILSGPNRAMQPRCAMRFESHTPKSLAM